MDLDGSFVRSIPVPHGAGSGWFATLPDSRFAMLDNVSDSVYFIDDADNLLAAVGMPVPANVGLQNLDGVVVGDALIISEDGYNHLLRADLNTYTISFFKDFSHLSGWLGAIDYNNGRYYICQAQKIYLFEDPGALHFIQTLGEDLYNITGIVVAGGHSFVALNFAGAVYRVNNTTGQIVAFLAGIDYPRDLELIGR